MDWIKDKQERKKYTEEFAISQAIKFLREKGFEGFIITRGGGGGVDIICNHNGHLAIVEVKGTRNNERIFSPSLITSKSSDLKKVLQVSEKFLEHYTNKGRTQTAIKHEFDIVLKETEHPVEVIGRLAELEQTKQALARYIQNKQDIIKVLYVEGGKIGDKLKELAPKEGFTIVHNNKIVYQTKDFQNIYSHPDEGGMPAVPRPGTFEPPKIEDIFVQHSPEEEKTPGDIQ